MPISGAQDTSTLQLFNVKDDISQSNNFYASNPEKVDQMKQVFDGINAEL